MDLPQMTDTEKVAIKEVLVLQMPPNSNPGELETTEEFNQPIPNAPPGLLSYPVSSKIMVKPTTQFFNTK